MARFVLQLILTIEGASFAGFSSVSPDSCIIHASYAGRVEKKGAVIFMISIFCVGAA